MLFEKQGLRGPYSSLRSRNSLSGNSDISWNKIIVKNPFRSLILQVSNSFINVIKYGIWNFCETVSVRWSRRSEASLWNVVYERQFLRIPIH